jgi:hypothetical protein
VCVLPFGLTSKKVDVGNKLRTVDKTVHGRSLRSAWMQRRPMEAATNCRSRYKRRFNWNASITG